jgi:hypothetical protein
MKRLTIVAMTVLFLANAPIERAHAGWFFLTEKVSSRGNSLATSKTFSTQAACVAKSQTSGIVVQGCVSDCDPANPTSEYFLEEEISGSFHGFGPYGFDADCEAGTSSAATAAIPNVTILSPCMFVTAKTACH